jgi:nucleoside-diphosphate-sugar epimerase
MFEDQRGLAVSVIVITGAAGLVGSMLRTRLARPGRTLRVLDIAPLLAGPGRCG